MVSRHVLFAAGSGIAVVAAVVVGIAVIPSPTQARLERLDAERVRDLSTISDVIERYRRTHDGVPATLNEVRQWNLSRDVRMNDPVSGQPYGYQAMDDSHYRLCARFDTVLTGNPKRLGRSSAFWSHGQGEHCYDIEVKLPVAR